MNTTHVTILGDNTTFIQKKLVFIQLLGEGGVKLLVTHLVPFFPYLEYYINE